MLIATKSGHVYLQAYPPLFVDGMLAVLRVVFLARTKSSLICTTTGSCSVVGRRLSFIATPFGP